MLVFVGFAIEDIPCIGRNQLQVSQHVMPINTWGFYVAWWSLPGTTFMLKYIESDFYAGGICEDMGSFCLF